MGSLGSIFYQFVLNRVWILKILLSWKVQCQGLEVLAECPRPNVDQVTDYTLQNALQFSSPFYFTNV